MGKVTMIGEVPFFWDKKDAEKYIAAFDSSQERPSLPEGAVIVKSLSDFLLATKLPLGPTRSLFADSPFGQNWHKEMVLPI